MIQAQQDRNIKGFTLLELIVVIAIVAIVSGVAYPNFSSWKKEREIRFATEKVANMIANIATQTQRGSFAYSQLWVLPVPGQSTVFITKGMKESTFSEILNNPKKKPACTITQNGHWDTLNNQTLKLLGTTFSDFYQAYDPESAIDKTELRTQISLGASLCFGKSGNYYKVTGDLSKISNTNISLEGAATPNYIIICTYENAKKTSNVCSRNAAGGLEKPAYLVKWSRFGNVSKYKWSGSDWNRQ